MIRKKENTLFLGINLGTSRTTVLSSRGAKGWMRSVVGQPRAGFGGGTTVPMPFIGEEALNRKATLDLSVPWKEGILGEGDEKSFMAVRALIAHAQRMADPGSDEQVYGILVVPARAALVNKGPLLKVAHEFMDLALVFPEPFMVAYGIDRLANAIIVDIGAATTNLCAMRGSIPGPGDQVTLLTGGDAIDKTLSEAINHTHPEARMTPAIAKKLKERFGHVATGGREMAMVELKIEGGVGLYDIAPEAGLACASILPPMIAAITGLIETFAPGDREAVVRNIVLTGGGSRIRGMARGLMSGLASFGEVQVHEVADPEFAGVTGALKLATELPFDYWTRATEGTGD
ncbi:MAG: cell division FtsA domain-containing protein [Magnetococcales bacterium]|nr:cell division FtsA domain-containing protein [Magnetococcales bacterium]